MTPFQPSGYSKVFGIFGCPIQHTLSPQMQHAAFEALGLPNTYLPFEVHPDQLKKAVESIVALRIQGINVTIPHKEKVIPFLDELDPEARKIGAVNTIKNDAGRLIGFNTDGKGYLRSLQEAGVDPTGMTVILIGSGGAAKGLAIALLTAGVEEMILRVRRKSAGEALAAQLKTTLPQSKVSVVGFNDIPNASIKNHPPTLLINTTPLGMKKDDPLPFPTSQIKPEWLVSDLIYYPNETRFLFEAKQNGAKTVSGLGMLLHQGALSFEIWTETKPPIEAMRQALSVAISQLK